MSCPEDNFQYYCKRLKRSVYFDYYYLLQVDSSANEEEIKKAYRSLARRYHPDRCEDSSKEMSKEKFKFISDAYTNLVDPIKRAAYNQFLLHMALKQKIKTCDVQGVSSMLQSCQKGDLIELLSKNFPQRTTKQSNESQYYPNWQQQYPQYQEQQQQQQYQSREYYPNEQQNQEYKQKIHEYLWQMKQQYCKKEQEQQQHQQHNQTSTNSADMLRGTTNDDSSTSNNNNNSVDDAISDETDEQQPPCRANNITTTTSQNFDFYQQFPLLRFAKLQSSEGKINCTETTPEININNNQSSIPSCTQKLPSEPQNTNVITEEAPFDQSAETVVRTPLLTKAHILQIQRASKEKKLVNRIKSKKSIFSCVQIAKKSICKQEK